MRKLQLIPSKKVIGFVEIPGSKSYTNRALLIAALIKGEVVIKNPLESDDTRAMIECLKELGIKIKVGLGEIRVIGDIGQIKEKEFRLNTRLSGTTIRFILKAHFYFYT